MQYLIYHEPHEIHGYNAIRISEADAIAKQRASCVRARGVDLYDSDEEALLDFIAVNWASWEDEVPVGLYTPFIPLQVTHLSKKEKVDK